MALQKALDDEWYHEQGQEAEQRRVVCDRADGGTKEEGMGGTPAINATQNNT